MSEESIAQIVTYIQQYQGTYTREGITQQLRTAGYTLGDVEAAWARVAPEVPAGGGAALPMAGPTLAARPDRFGDWGAPPPRPALTRTPAFWVTLVGTIVADYMLLGILFAVATSLGFGTYGGPITLVLLIIALGAQVAALVVGARLSSSNYSVSRGILLGLLIADIVLPFCAGIILFGICVASFRNL